MLSQSQSLTPEQLLSLFQTILIGSSTEQIRSAELQLQKLQGHPLFLNIVLFIIEQSQVDANIRKMAAVYLRKWAKRLVKQRNSQRIQMSIETLLTALGSYNIPLHLKPNLMPALESLLSSEGGKLPSLLSGKLLQILKQLSTQPTSSLNFEYLLFYGQAILSNTSFTEQVGKFVGEGLIEYTGIIRRITQSLPQCVQNQQILQKMLLLLKQYSILMKMFMKRFTFVDLKSAQVLYYPQLQEMISEILAFTLSSNPSSSLFFTGSSNYSKSAITNSNLIKSNFISFTNSILKYLLSYVREPSILKTNPIYMKMPQYLKLLIKDSGSLLRVKPYYQQGGSILNTVDQIFGLLVTALRVNEFYSVFHELKDVILQDLIFRSLAASPHDQTTFYENPEEFINSLIHIVDREVLMSSKKRNAEDQDEVQQYETFRTFSADLLNCFCKFQDGSISEVFKFVFVVLQGKINSQFTKSTMLLVACIMRSIAKQRIDIHEQLSRILLELLSKSQPPHFSKSSSNPPASSSDMEYILLLFTISKYWTFIKQIYPMVVDDTFSLVARVLSDSQSQQITVAIVLELVQCLNMTEEGEVYAPRILDMYNNILQASLNQPNIRLFDAYFSLFKYNDSILKSEMPSLKNTLNLLSSLVHLELQKAQPSQLIINKTWNVIRHIGENKEFGEETIALIEEAVMPLISFIDGIKNWDFQEDILLLMTAWMLRTKKVSQNQQKMFEIIPKIFYNQYKANFGQAFHTIQTFIFYGKNLLMTSPAAIKAIIEMCLTSLSSRVYMEKNLSESDNCQGVLLLQSLVIGCGAAINAEQWAQIIKAATKKLAQPLKFNLLKSNLIALLSLCFSYSHKYFPSQENDIMLSHILGGLKYFSRIKYSPKVYTIGLCQMMTLIQFEYVAKRFTQIFDQIITLLQVSTLKQPNLFDADEDEEDQERDYENLLLTVVNSLTQIDQFQHFKNRVEQLKVTNMQLLQQSVAQLPAAKRGFLKHILSVERVMNEPRQIYKIKRN